MRALCTGITGQTGSFLAEILLEKGYKVYGLVRRTSTPNTSRIKHILNELELVQGDLTDQSSLDRILRSVKPHEVYNMGAQSDVHMSFTEPITTADITGLGTLRLLEAIRNSEFRSKFLTASSSEMFGKVTETPQNENTRFHPRSPYGVSKLFAHWATINYRESYNLFAISAIMYNNESERRGENFVTRKISKAVANIKLGKQKELILGNTDAKRDWGYSKDYALGLYLAMQYSIPKEWIFATGESHSVQEFLETAFRHVGLEWQQYVKRDTRFTRPAEVDTLCGNSTEAKTLLDWRPTISFQELVELMVDYDLETEARNSNNV
jgi:GDPmannose 4,6-dehydratase